MTRQLCGSNDHTPGHWLHCHTCQQIRLELPHPALNLTLTDARRLYADHRTQGLPEVSMSRPRIHREAMDDVNALVESIQVETVRAVMNAAEARIREARQEDADMYQAKLAEERRLNQERLERIQADHAEALGRAELKRAGDMMAAFDAGRDAGRQAAQLEARA
ncbi:hypothetical protein [Brevibacterium moorei]|uniref:hypothetical protein n=1 Tax=Brevibacterium moorei TaxID=2968457 RepID=UPI00211B96D2|nr:hypothetical protein [Brevibacterium sp. 68QC2CO]MCQ9384407.1 hypothetical protein [Brevibacterium sp. 68QC2CO]